MYRWSEGGPNCETDAVYEYKLKLHEMTNTQTWQNDSYLTAFDGESSVFFGALVDVSAADDVYIYTGVAKVNYRLVCMCETAYILGSETFIVSKDDRFRLLLWLLLFVVGLSL